MNFSLKESFVLISNFVKVTQKGERGGGKGKRERAQPV